jgi:hypothetical protein
MWLIWVICLPTGCCLSELSTTKIQLSMLMVFYGFCVAHLVFCIICFVWLHSVSCAQCCQWSLDCPFVLPVVSGLFILDCPFVLPVVSGLFILDCPFVLPVVSGFFILDCPFVLPVSLNCSFLIVPSCCQWSLDCSFLIVPSVVFSNVYLLPIAQHYKNSTKVVGVVQSGHDHHLIEKYLVLVRI